MSEGFYMVVVGIAISFNWTAFILQGTACYATTCILLVWCCGELTKRDIREMQSRVAEMQKGK